MSLEKINEQILIFDQEIGGFGRNALTGLSYIHTLAFFQVPVKIKPIDLFYKLSSHASSFYLDASSSKPLFSPRKRQKKSKTPLLDLLHCTRLGGGVRLLCKNNDFGWHFPYLLWCASRDFTSSARSLPLG